MRRYIITMIRSKRIKHRNSLLSRPLEFLEKACESRGISTQVGKKGDRFKVQHMKEVLVKRIVDHDFPGEAT